MTDVGADALLSPEERRTLHAVCETFVPALAPSAGESAELFTTSASAVGVPEAIEVALTALSPTERGELRRLLRLLDTRFAVRLLGGPMRAFAALDAEARERLLLVMAEHRIGRVRSGYQALKRLTTFLYAALLDENGRNPIWPSIGYEPAPPWPARAPALTVTRIERETVLEADACIVGSGAGGGVVAALLAAAGRRVIVLEAGPADQSPDFDQRELIGFRRLFHEQGLSATRDLGVGILAGIGLGGGTTVNWQTSLRTPGDVRDHWAECSGCRHFIEPGFTAAIDAVCRRLGVGISESIVNRNNDVLRRGAERLGWRTESIPRNARGCDPKQCGYCSFGCRHGGKQSVAVTWLADAQRDGDTLIVADCRAERILWERGRVFGVHARATDARTGAQYVVQVRAPRVVVAAGALQSPVLLLRSAIPLPAIGRHLYLHPTTAALATHAEPVRGWDGPPQTVLCQQFARVEGAWGFRLEAVPAHPGLSALAIPWTGAREYRRRLQQMAHAAAVIVLTRDEQGGRVRASADGRAIVDYSPGKRERRLLAQGMAAALRLHLAAGAEEVFSLHTTPMTFSTRASSSADAIDAFSARVAAAPVHGNRAGVFSAHQMGTCRMGRSPRDAVCDGSGEVFGVRGLYVADASAFPASSGVNPMITVMALAHHVATRMLGR